MNKRYFAASNSTEGFVSHYPEIFGDCRRIYIVKGGPGTGKSRFLSELAKGREATLYFCSSDPDSLDGVILGDTAVIDGTAPHVWEPKLVGAHEELLNLGAFWDAARLRERREEIARLTAEKSAAYEGCYSYLAALGKCEKGCYGRLSFCVDSEKIYRAAKRLLHGVRSGEGRHRIGLCRAVSMKGLVYFDSYERADEAISVCDYLGSGHMLLDALRELCFERGIDTVESRSPLFSRRLDALYLPQYGKSFYIGEGEGTLSMRRFFVPTAIRAERQGLRAVRAVQEELLSLALSALADAREAHFALEEIYSSAMDFEKKEAFTQKVKKRLFS